MGARGPKPKGPTAMTAAERQAAYRARRAEGKPLIKVVIRKPTDRRSRAQRWADAAQELLDLQAEYQEWLDNLPDGGSEATREALATVCDLDLSMLEIDPPKGFGRD